MDVTKLGVRITRARARTTMAVAQEIADNSRPVKRRKFGNKRLRSHSSTFAQTQTLGHDINYVHSASPLEEEPMDSVSIRSGGVPASCCSSTGSVDMLKVLDLEEEIISVEYQTAERYNLDGSESKPTREDKAESGELELTTMKHLSVKIKPCSKFMPVEKMPPESELEEFFAAANEDLKKPFHKYNYDIVNDIPLKGRFEWIQLKPNEK